MKFSFSWLKDHLETKHSLDDVCQSLNMIGLEVEDVYDPSLIYKDFTVCEIKTIKKHPNADKLNLCLLKTHHGEMEVICGADNVKIGMKAVFAPEGSFIPGLDSKLYATKIRGIKSAGMLLSEYELALSDSHDGIVELPDNAKIGDGICGYIDKEDSVVEISVTPNRSDALGIRGIARDLSAAGIGTLKEISLPNLDSSFSIERPIEINKSLKDHGIYASFRLIRNIKNIESPEWIKRRLELIGLRSINALVDITNYMTYDLGRPLHVFDYDKIVNGLVIRNATNNETIETLDGKIYKLDPSIVVFADDISPDSIAGIMGGKRTGCDDGTQNVLIESAIWDKINIAKTGRNLGILSDARYRFERGVDKDFINQGLDIASKMVLEICGGDVSKRLSVGAEPERNKEIIYNYDEVDRLLGVSFEDNEIKSILNKLGFETIDQGKNLVKIRPPSWRHDISEKACIVEEIIRIKGTDQIKSVPLKKSESISSKKFNSKQTNRFLSKRILANRGLIETVSYSFIAERYASIFGHKDERLRLQNPISSEFNILRPSLIPNLISSTKKNNDRGIKNISMFEVSHCFKGIEEDDQFDCAAGVRFGKAVGLGGDDDWRNGARNYDVYDVKEDVITLLRAFKLDDHNYQISADAPSYYHPGKSGVVRQGPKNIIACFGEVNPKILSKFGLEGRMFCFEIFIEKLEALNKQKSKARKGFKVSDLMPITRDFAFVFDKSTNGADIVSAIKKIKEIQIEDIKIFDIYTGKNIPKDKKSIGINITIQPYEKTLTDSQIEDISNKIISEISGKFNADIRS
tara:strand:- start:14858 stop:17272 length:2415 start_codon:yes stop_codon:yes gene_type:complete